MAIEYKGFKALDEVTGDVDQQRMDPNPLGLFALWKQLTIEKGTFVHYLLCKNT
jgi:hypothetical protein